MATQTTIKDPKQVTTIQVNGKSRKKVRTIFSKNNPQSVSKTQQHFREETNIGNIVKRYNTSGLLTNPMVRPTVMPQFGDFTNVVDFHTMQNKMVEIKNYFATLPADVRTFFQNDPQNLLTYMSDPNLDKAEARKLGLIGRDLSNLKYVKTLDDNTQVDITEEVIKNRGLFVDGQRVNKDGTLYVEVQDKPAETSPEIPEA